MALAAPLPSVAPADRLDTLPPWPWGPLDPDAPPTLGWHAIAWAEGWDGFPGLIDGWHGLTQPNGPRARKRFRFTERQKTFLLWFYALDAEAQWIYAGAVRRLAKGSGKSPFAAVIALIEFLAPVRLLTFRRGEPGGVEGVEVMMPLVQIVATAESQTQNTMRYVRAFAPKKSHVVEFYDLDPGKTIYYGLPEKTLEVITSSVTASEGAETTFAVKDEEEHWKPSNKGPELSATIEDNLAKSGARSLGTCNAWIPNQESVAEAEWVGWVLEQEGKTTGETRILYDAVIAPPDTDMADAEQLQCALQRIYGDCDWKKPHEADPDHPGDLRPVPGSAPDVRPIMRRIWNVASDPDDSQRKYLNRPVAAEGSWIDPAWWQLMADYDRVVEPGEPIVMFFDGSKSRDATGLVGVTMEDGHAFTIGAWEPLLDGHNVPPHEVDAAVARAFRTWKVVGFFGDVVEWESFVKVDWPALYADRLAVKAVPTGLDLQPIAWDMRTGSHQYAFTHAAELVRAEIEAGLFTHDGHPALGRHVANAKARENRYGTTIGKETRDSPYKIDLAVCLIGARMVRQLAIASGVGSTSTKSRKLKTR